MFAVHMPKLMILFSIVINLMLCFVLRGILICPACLFLDLVIYGGDAITISFVNSMRYLWVQLNSNLLDDDDILRQVGFLHGRPTGNKLKHRSSKCSSAVKNTLFRSGPVSSRFDRFYIIGTRTLRGPAQVGFFFCIIRYKIGESINS